MDIKDFIKWEQDTFGYGYGTGEVPIFIVLKKFMEKLTERRCYDYTQLEKVLGKSTTWLFINALCKSDTIEYGTSPRYGWLTKKGEELRDFIEDKSVEELYAIILGE